MRGEFSLTLKRLDKSGYLFTGSSEKLLSITVILIALEFGPITWLPLVVSWAHFVFHRTQTCGESERLSGCQFVINASKLGKLGQYYVCLMKKADIKGFGDLRMMSMWCFLSVSSESRILANFELQPTPPFAAYWWCGSAAAWLFCFLRGLGVKSWKDLCLTE